MFIRVNSTPNSPRKSIQIVESIRTGDKVKQKIVHYVGIAIDDDSEAKLKLLGEELIVKIEKKRLAEQASLFKMTEGELDFAAGKKALGRKKQKRLEDIAPPSEVKLSEVFEESRIIEGVDEIATQVYEDLGFNEILSSKRYASVLKDVVLTRLIEPYSKLKLCRVMLNDFGKDYNEDQIYRMMDKLYDKIDDIKIKVFNKTHALMPEINVLLFDVTTLYCESITQDDLREFGFGKDGKFNNTQVVLALATNDLGLPVGYELFQGNYAEVKTLCYAIENWKKLFDIKGVCFIGDRGMFSNDNLQMLEDYGYEYIIAAKLRSLSDKMQEQILDEDNYIIEGFGKDIGWVGNFEYPVEDGYICRLANDETELKAESYVGFAVIGTDKNTISKMVHIDNSGVLTYNSEDLASIQSKISKLRLSSAKCNCDVMTIEEYQKNKAAKANRAILIIKDDEIINGETISANLASIIYSNEEVRLNTLSNDIQAKIRKEGSSLKLSSSLMFSIFKDYVAIKQIAIPIELMMEIFPLHNFAKRRLCVSYKPARARNDLHKRDKILKRLGNKQGKTQQLLKTTAKRYMTAVDEKINLDLEKIAEDREWDGMHGIVTNINDSKASDLIRRYSNLWRIEEAFRINKHNLRMRPIYHFKPERIKSHIALCYMTFAILKLIQYQTQLTQPRHTIDNILETMLSVQASIYTHKITGDQYRLPGKMSHDAVSLYRAFGVKRSIDAEVYLRDAK